MNYRDPGNRMIWWLAQAAIDARGEVSGQKVAKLAGVSPQTVYNFEKGTGWGQNLEGLLAAYAEVGEYEDARDLIQEALDQWRQHGSAPVVPNPDESPPIHQPQPGREGRDAPLRAAERLLESERDAEDSRPDHGQADSGK